jgi:hypothetical protein
MSASKRIATISTIVDLLQHGNLVGDFVYLLFVNVDFVRFEQRNYIENALIALSNHPLAQKVNY